MSLDKILQVLPSIAQHPLAIVAYIVVIVCWFIVALQTRKSNQLFHVIKNLPEADRLEAIRLEYRTSPKVGLSAEQWLRSRRMLLIFAGFGITIFAIVLLLLFALIISAQLVGSAVRSYYGIASGTSVPINPSGKVSFVVEQANVEKVYSSNSERQTQAADSIGYLLLHNATIDIRFTLFNGTAEKIKFVDFRAVEYFRNEIADKGGGPRQDFEISPESPFISQNRTFEVAPNDNLSFTLRYTMTPLFGYAAVIFGLEADYDSASHSVYKVKSDALIYATIGSDTIADTSDAGTISVTNTDPSFQCEYCDVLFSPLGFKQTAVDAIKKHNSD